MLFFQTNIIFDNILKTECANDECFKVTEGKCSKGEPGIEVKSTTECLLHCGMAKCMNSLIENQKPVFALKKSVRLKENNTTYIMPISFQVSYLGFACLFDLEFFLS